MAKKEPLGAMGMVRAIGEYVSLVQSGDHARRGRVVMFWSLISLLVVRGVFEVVSTEQSFGVFGISLSDLDREKILVILLFITAYYALRFGFTVAKIFALVKPFALLKSICEYRSKYKKWSRPDFTSKTNEEQSAMYPWIQVWAWIHGKSVHDRYPHLKKIYPLDVRGDGIDHYIDNTSKSEVQHLNMRLAWFGVLENFLALLVLPTFLCGWALCALAREVWHLIVICFADFSACIAPIFS